MAAARESLGDPLSRALDDVVTVLVESGIAYALIGGKLLAFRLQDQTDIESLVAANRDDLDADWIKREWQTIFDLDDPRMLWLLGQLSDTPRQVDS